MTPGLVSDIPGRMRVRLAPEQRTRDFMSALRERLAATDGLHTVDARPATGSMVIHYDAEGYSREHVINTLEAAGVRIIDAPDGATHRNGNQTYGSTTATANRLVDVMADANEAIARATGRSLDLRLLFPFALGSWGIVRLARDGLQLGEVPAYVLLWYAFDAFWKLNYAPRTPAPREIPPDDLE